MIKTNCPKLVKNSIIPAIALLLLVPSIAFASTDSTINFQGKIVRNDTGYEGLNVTTGSPACVVSGNSNDTCDFQVQYFGASSGGTALLTEDFANVEIGQYNGAFTLSLGSDSTPTAGTYSTLEEMVNAVSDLYIELSFAPGGSGSFTETFSRMPIQASAYALRAKYASGANTAFQFDTAADDSGYTSPSEGMVYYDTTDNELKVYDGSTWGSLGGGTGSLFTDGGIFTYLTALTDHFVLGSSSYTAIGADSYTTYLSGLSSRSPFSFDMTAERLTLSGSQAQSGLTVYSNYNSTGAWPVVTMKAEGSNFDNVVLQVVQDGTGNMLSLQKGSTEAFIFENPLTFYIHPRTDAPSVYANRLYNINGTLYWNGSTLGGGSSLWTDGGTFTYLTSTTDDVVIGGSTLGSAAFFFDVSTGNFGIGTSTPGARLEIAGSDSTISNSMGDITISPDDTVVIKANDTQADNLMEWQNSSGTVLGLINQNGYATFGGSTSNTSAILTLGASTSGVAQLNFASGFDVSAPNTGDMWWNGTSLFFYDGSTSVDLLTAGGGSEVLSSYGTASNTGYINVQHNTNSYDVVASGWICDGGSSDESCTGGNWKNITETDFTVRESLSNQWNDADSDGIIRSIIKLTDVELMPGIDVGTGADGAITVSGTTNINTQTLITGRSCADGGDAVNYSITAFNAAGTEATLSATPATGCLGVDDEVLIINLQGTSSAYGNVGNYETLRIASVSGTTVAFKTAKTKYYGTNLTDDANLGTVAGTQRVMLQRVPNYTNVIVNTGVSFAPSSFSSGKGGVMFFRASGSVSVIGSINANGSGYVAGIGYASNGGIYGGYSGESFCGAGGGNANQFNQAGSNGVCGGGGGGGSYTSSVYAGGTGSATLGGAGGGGGGAAGGTNYGGGGAGGGYGTYGTYGYGAYNASNGGTSSSGNGSSGYYGSSNSYGGAGGGGGTYGVSDLSKIMFGSGGGSGGTCNAYVQPNGTGHGGGIVILSVNTLSVSGSVQSNGAAGNAGTSSRGGGGGGGAGGSVKILGNTVTLGTSLVTATGGAGGSSTYSGGTGGSGRIAVYTATAASGTTSPTATSTTVGYYGYGVYNSSVISTPNAQSYDNIMWDSSLNTYGKISVQTRSGTTDDPTADGLAWSKLDNAVPTDSDSESTEGRIPLGTSGKGDSVGTSYGGVILDGSVYKMWYSGTDGTNYRIYYATSSDGLTWTKYDNTIPSASDTTSTNGRIPLGTSGKGDSAGSYSPSVIKDGATYKMWYSGYDGTNTRIYYATSSDGLTWTKYDNTIPSASDTTSTNGRIPIGTSGKGDSLYSLYPSVLKDGVTYKMWYSGVDGTNYRVYYATSPDGLTWTKYDNTIPSASDTTSTNGRIPLGTTGKGDSSNVFGQSVIKDGTIYRMWYTGSNGGFRGYYATSSDGLTWTKYDNTIPSASDISSTNGRIPMGTSGNGDSSLLRAGCVIKDGNDYKMWYAGYDGSNYRIYYVSATDNSGTWEEWRPYTNGTNYTTLESADTHTTWSGTNATVAEGDIGRDVDYFEDEDEPLTTNLTKVTSSTNGGYAESTIASTNLSNYDYLTLWVRASQTGNVLRIGMGESAATEQYEEITIDAANVWQKVYWDLSDITSTSRDAITKLRLTNFSTTSNTIYLDNVKVESLLDTGAGSVVSTTPNNYFQYRVIFTTTNTAYIPLLENIAMAWNSGYRIVMYDANNTRLYNYSGVSQYLRLDVVASTSGGGGGGGGFVNGLAVSAVQDGTDAIAFQFDTSMTFTDPTSKLMSVLNNGTEMMYLDADGNLYVAGSITAGNGLGAALLNNSGGTVTTRSLVTVDTTANSAFTTTTVAGMQGAMGVVQGVKIGGDTDGDGNCDSGDICLVVFEGTTNVELDNASSSSRGDYIYTSTTAGKGHSASSTTQTNGLVGIVTSIANIGSGYVQMVFDAQNKITADLYLNINIGLDKSAYRDMYNQLANDYAGMTDAERRGVVESTQSQSVMFDSFVDSLKMDSENSSVGIDGDAQRAGLWGGLTIDGTTTDIAGNRYLGSATATLLTSKYYDRSQTGLQGQDSTPETLVDLGIDPNWYNGVSLQTASNLTTSYNGSLVSVSGVYATGSEHGYLDLSVTGTTVYGITANIVSSDGNCTATGASLAFGSSYSFTSGSCSGSTITIKPVRGDYKSGDVFRIASWYLEPTTSDDRGSEKVFPQRAVIIGSKDTSLLYLTIVDADTQRVWMKFVSNTSAFIGGKMLPANTNYTINAMDVLNGQLYVVNNSTSADVGYVEFNFINDAAFCIFNTGTLKFSGNTGIGGRDTGSGYAFVNTTVSVITNEINDVSVAVIPNQPAQEMTVSGWGSVNGSANPLSETVYLPYKFDGTPLVTTSITGYSAGVAPSSLGNCVGAGWGGKAVASAPTQTSFLVSVQETTSAPASNIYYCYTWTATGTVSPKQAVALATGDTGVDGGTTVINKTDQSSTNYLIGTHHSDVLWQNKVALDTKGDIYISHNDDTANSNILIAYYGVLTRPSETTWASMISGYYDVAYAGFWSNGGPVILGSGATNQIKYLYVKEGSSTIDEKSNTIYVGTSLGVSVIQEKQSGNATLVDGSDEKKGTVQYYTKDYISEKMVGDIRGMWPLNYDNTSADNEDVSTKANALTAVNITSADAVSGVRGTAVDFNGTDEYLYCTDATCGGTTKTDIAGNVTISAWINPANVTGTKAILGKGDGGTSPYYNYRFYMSGSNLVFNTYNGTNYTVTATGAIPTANTWYHVVANYNGSVLRLYVNGAEVASLTGVPAAAIVDNTERFTIGSIISVGSPVYYFAGIIDEPTVTATVLSAEQIKSQYEEGLRALKGSHSSSDIFNQLYNVSDVRSLLITPDNKYMYVGTEGGGISQIDLTSSTRTFVYVTGTSPAVSTNNVESLSGRYYPVLSGDIGSSARLMGVDSNGDGYDGTYYSRTVSFDTATNRAYLWMSAYVDSSDTSSSITVSASNDGGDNYVAGTLVKTNTTGIIPEYEYTFTFPSSDKDYKVKFDIERGSSNKAATYITKWGLAQMELSDGTVNGLFTETNNTVVNGSYLDVVHGQNTYDLVANGWVFDTALNEWVEVTDTDSGITQNLSNQWEDAATGGIIRTIIESSYIAPSTNGLTWTKYDNTIPSASDTTSTNGRIPLGTSGKGDSAGLYSPSVIKEGATYKMWYSGYDGTNTRIYYATSSDGLTWTKYDNTVPTASNTTGTNGRIPLGTTGGDTTGVFAPTVIKDGTTYKMWYTGSDGTNYRIYYATSPDGLTWTKYNNTVPTASNTTGTNGRIPLGTSGGDVTHAYTPAVTKDGNTYKMWYSGSDGANSRIYYATSSDGLTWTKYDNTVPTASNTTGTNGRIPIGTTGGDTKHAFAPTVIKDGNTYKMWFSGCDVTYYYIYYATSPDGLTWTKYDNTIPTASNTTGTNGRIPLGTSGGDTAYAIYSAIIKDGTTYKMWYSGYVGTNFRIYYATSSYPYGIYNSSVISTPNAHSYDNIRWDSALGTYGKISVQTRSGATSTPTDGTWEEWRPYTSGTSYTTLESADTHTAWSGTNATVAEGDIGRDVDYFEDEDEPLTTNLTKVTSSTNGGYAESTIASTNLSNYDYLTLWVRASQTGNVLRIGMGESAATEQYEEITIDAANVWQKVYWDLSDITSTSRDAITKLRLTNFSTSSNVIYLDNVRGESLLDNGSGNIVASTPDEYFQYRVIFTTTNLSYQPQLENISLTYSSGFKIQLIDANTVRLYNNSGKTQKLKLDVILGSAAIDLRATQYSVNIAPSSAQIDTGNNTNSIWINKMGTGGNLLKLQTNSVDMMVVSAEGDMTLAGDVAIGGSVVLGATGDQGTIRYNATDNRIEFSNDGVSWMELGDNTRAITLSAEYAGAVLSGDGSDNVGSMTSDNTGSSSNSMNYYEWSSSAVALNDYDVRVRFTLPSDFVSWGNGGVTLNYATESTSNTNNKVDMYVYLEGSATVDGSSTAQVSSSVGVWTSTNVAGTGLDECNAAGETCVIILRMSSLGDNYVRTGDIDITYNRSL